MLLSLPEAILYNITDLASHHDVFKFAVMTEHLLFKVMESMQIEYILTLLNFIFILVLFPLWINAVYPFVPVTSACLLIVVNFPACCNTSFNMLGTIWVGDWIHSICISISQAFCFVLAAAFHLGFVLYFCKYSLKVFCVF